MTNVTRPVFPLCVTDRHLLQYGTTLPSCRLFSIIFTTAFMKSANKCLSLLLKFLLLFFLSIGNSVHALSPLSLSSLLAPPTRNATGDGRGRVLSDRLDDHISEPAASKYESCRTIPKTAKLGTAANDKEICTIELESAIPPYLKHNKALIPTLLTVTLTRAPLGGQNLPPSWIFSLTSKPLQISTQNFVYLILHLFDIQ